MSTPGVIEADSGGLYSHAIRSQNRATDYHVHQPGVPDDGWPSQRAYADAYESMAQAGEAFGNRQHERGSAVNAAADGFSGQDQDSAKLLQGFMGAFMQALGSMGQAFAGAFQGLFQGGAQALGGGATALSGMLTSGANLLQPVVKATPAGAGVQAGASGGAPVPGMGAAVTPAALGGSPSHSAPPKGGRPEGRDGELTVAPAVVMPGGMGGFGAARPREQEPSSGQPVRLVSRAVESEPPTQPIPVAVPIKTQEA